MESFHHLKNDPIGVSSKKQAEVLSNLSMEVVNRNQVSLDRSSRGRDEMFAIDSGDGISERQSVSGSHDTWPTGHQVVCEAVSHGLRCSLISHSQLKIR